MNDRQKRRYERLTRSASFAAERGDSFPANSKGGQALARMNELIEEAAERDTERATNLRTQQQATGSRADGRADLRSQLSAIADTAETIGLDHAEVKGAFARPRAGGNDQSLLSVARSFAAAAAPLKARFVEYDMPADFLERLNTSIDGFEQAIGQQTSGANARVAANASLEDILARAEDELERLDTAIRNKYRNDHATLAAWESARRLEHAPKTKNKATRTTAPPTTTNQG
jgi:hypothetical protein